MKKVKKIFAILMTMAMIMGFGMTAMAATTPAPSGEKGDITITGLAKTEQVTVNIYNVVTWNQTKGNWDIAEWINNDTNRYVDLSKETESERIQWESIRGLVNDSTPKAAAEQKTNTGTVTFSGLSEGAYLIVAAGTDTQYNAMGALTYMYDSTTNLLIPADVTLSAKGSTYDLTKTLTDSADTFVFRGEEVEFDITATFPSFDDSTKNKDRVFTITDTPTNMKITDISVTVGTKPCTIDTDYTLVDSNGDPLVLTNVTENQAVTVKFDDGFIGDNTYAGENVKVHVTATVTGENGFSNTASNNKGGSTDIPVTGKTGTLVITKQDSAGKKLKGAEFNVKNSSGEALQFVETTTPGTYKLAMTGEDKASAVVTTPESGIITIKGLDEGTYSIVETKAPDGYAMNPVITAKDDIFTITENTTETIELTAVDSKLASLPSTGGIGTTIFTIGGIVIMLGAAGLFFANRRKSNSK